MHNLSYPFGVRGVGEVPVFPSLAAIAVYDAIGARSDDLLLMPDRVLAAIQEETD